MIGNRLPSFDFTLYDIVCAILVVLGAVIPIVITVFLVMAIVTPASATVTLVYPPDTGDGYVGEDTNGDFLTVRNDTGDVVDQVPTISEGMSMTRTALTTTAIHWLRRHAMSFNTSSIPDDDIIDSVVLGVGTTTEIYLVGLGDPGVGITGFSPADPTNIVAGDYDSYGNTRYATDKSLTDFPDGILMNWSFNSAGLSAINKTGYTSIMIRLGTWDIDANISSLALVKNKFTGIKLADTSNANATVRPWLEVTHHSPVTAPVASFTVNKNFIRIPNSVTATDTSTNTPTEWSWDWGDGSTPSTTQNPTHQYTKRGKFSIVLTATNAGGSDASDATTVRVVGYENYY